MAFGPLLQRRRVPAQERPRKGAQSSTGGARAKHPQARHKGGGREKGKKGERGRELGVVRGEREPVAGRTAHSGRSRRPRSKPLLHSAFTLCHAVSRGRVLSGARERNAARLTRRRTPAPCRSGRGRKAADPRWPRRGRSCSAAWPCSGPMGAASPRP